MRWILEGTWSGYTSSQSRVVHRETTRSLKVMESWKKLGYAISYTDGTCLILHVRPAEPREKIKEVNGYGSLIRDCLRHGVSSVDGLIEARKQKATATKQ